VVHDHANAGHVEIPRLSVAARHRRVAVPREALVPVADEASKISYQQFVANKLSTRVEMADAVLPDLLKAAGDTEAARSRQVGSLDGNHQPRRGVVQDVHR